MWPPRGGCARGGLAAVVFVDGAWLCPGWRPAHGAVPLGGQLLLDLRGVLPLPGPGPVQPPHVTVVTFQDVEDDGHHEEEEQEEDAEAHGQAYRALRRLRGAAR